MSIKLLHTLLSKAGQLENKRDIILEATNGRTASSKEMSAWELSALCGRLKALAPKTPEEQAKERQRRKVIGLLKEARYTMPEVLKWVSKQVETPFNNCTKQELNKLIYAATQVRDHYLSKIRTNK